ncbi:TPA: hypothetical protein EYN98_25350 [Candidatus Poribacteria bacterium]|nr:hypothetical protein [Candidatus Poribacteria bacterium]
MLTPISAKTTTWLLSIPTLLADCTTTIRPGGTVWVKIWTATIGTASENPMRLCSCDWAWVYADNQNNICGCVMDSGTWHVEVAKEGRYSLTLRRWPQESELGISASAPVMQGVDGSWSEGKALPVASAWLQVGDIEQQQPVALDATQVTFEMALTTGATTFKSWWYNTEGDTLAGAYYLTVERLEPI